MLRISITRQLYKQQNHNVQNIICMRLVQFHERVKKNILTQHLLQIQREIWLLKWIKFIYLILISRVQIFIQIGKITYKQSQTFTAGKQICVFDTQYCKFGLGICYDLRFAQLGLLMSKKGARVLIYPGSFNQVTGPLHWQLLLRGRALDTQCYTIGVSCAQYKQDPNIYQAWGHSTAVDPFGKVLVSLDENPNIAYYEIDPNYCEQVRQNIPIMKQKRYDLYKLEEL